MKNHNTNSHFLPVYSHEGADLDQDGTAMKALLKEPCYKLLRPFFDSETGFPKPTERTGPDITGAWHYRGYRLSALAEDRNMAVPLRLLAAQAFAEGTSASLAFTFAVSS